MTQFLLTIKDDKKGKALMDFLKKIDFIEIHTEEKKPKKTEDDLFALAGIWKGRNITKKSIRKKAWNL